MSNIANKRYQDYIDGQKLEDHFINQLKKYDPSLTYVKSTIEQDAVEGWDVRIVTSSIDKIVDKRIDIKRRGNDKNWIELVAYTSKHQKLGWLFRGKAEYVVFYLVDKDVFYFLSKEKLKEAVYEKIPHLKDLERRAKLMISGSYEDNFLKLINDNWGDFKIVNNKEQAIYQWMYSRPQYDHEPDLIFKITNGDVEYYSEFQINGSN